jgi:hypothetical protein
VCCCCWSGNKFAAQERREVKGCLRGAVFISATHQIGHKEADLDYGLRSQLVGEAYPGLEVLPVDIGPGDPGTPRAVTVFGGAARQVAGGWIKHSGILKIDVDDIVIVFGEWNHDVPAKTEVCCQPLIDLDIRAQVRAFA